MTGTPKTTACGWDQATVSCGRCGARHTATSEADYLKAVRVHHDAHTVWDRLDPITRDGLVSILRGVLADLDLSVELLALADRLQTGSDSQ